MPCCTTNRVCNPNRVRGLPGPSGVSVYQYYVGNNNSEQSFIEDLSLTLFSDNLGGLPAQNSIPLALSVQLGNSTDTIYTLTFTLSITDGTIAPSTFIVNVPPGDNSFLFPFLLTVPDGIGSNTLQLTGQISDYANVNVYNINISGAFRFPVV